LKFLKSIISERHSRRDKPTEGQTSIEILEATGSKKSSDTEKEYRDRRKYGN
jgi:hypothetical protein